MHQLSEFALSQHIPWIFQRKGGAGDDGMHSAPAARTTTTTRIGAAAPRSRQITSLPVAAVC